MKKQSVLALAFVLGLSPSVSFPAQAANGYNLNGKQQTKNYVVVQGQVKNLPEIKSTLEDLCERLQNGSWKDCPTIILPDCNQSGGDSRPEAPDNNAPDTDQPELNAPDQDTPADSVPDNDQSGGNNNQPDKPDTNLPGNNESGGNGSQPNTPDTEPDVNKPGNETDKPETDNEALSYAEQVVKLVNEERAKVGLHALKIDTEVSSAAMIRAQEIQTSFSHTRPDGRKFSSVLTDNNIRFTGAGENIAWGQTSPEKVMEAWMNSEGHRANILNAKFTKIGVGHLQNAAGRNYWVQLFTY